MPEHTEATKSTLIEGLGRLPSDRDRFRALLDLVRERTAGLLEVDPGTIDADRAYSDYGYSSLAAVELTGRLGKATGLTLPLTLLFDHPTPAAVAARLLVLLGFTAASADAGAAGAGEAGEPVGAADAVGDGPGDARDPVVVVGMGCRFPGGVGSAGELWDVVAGGRDVTGGFPVDRGWDLGVLGGGGVGSSAALRGGFLGGAGEFDADFFGISRREALAMDPQQRLLLETVWEACEDAGVDPASLRGSATGVYVGSSGQDYERVASAGPADLAGYWGIGSAGSVLSGRVAYVLGLEGPALTVDTACSSSLVALHLAAEALRRGECELALAGGAAVMATPKIFTEFSRQGAMSVDGRCRSFAESAGGTGWSEGVGVLVVERLSRARVWGHRVLAVVAGSAVNQDGGSNGLTAPSGGAQRRVVEAALVSAGLSAGDVDVVEGHGTATRLGDPIEVEALSAVFGGGGGGRPGGGGGVWLGSLKSNVGHAQAAAGVGGVIKMVMALRCGVLPVTLHVDRPTSRARWEGVRLLTEPVAWPRDPGRPRRAGVSAFGVGGTNAHVLLEEAPAEDERRTAPRPSAAGGAAEDVAGAGAQNASPESGTEDRTERADGAGAGAPSVWVLSGRTGEALREQARRLHDKLAALPQQPPAPDVAAALALTRTPFEHRAALVGADTTALLHTTAALARELPGVQGEKGAAGEALRRGRARPGRTAFVFPGQGSQWIGMGRELAAVHPVFSQALADCADALARWTDWSPHEVLAGRPGAASLERVDVVQPALFAVMTSLAALWRHHGVRPDAVVGHSQGEIAAACVAGGLGLDDAARLVALRSRAIAGLAGAGGGMVSVTAEPARVEALLERFDGRISVAAVNGPSSLTLSGDGAALEAFLDGCAAEGVWARRVPVDYASHSPQVDGIERELADLLAPITPVSGDVAFHSTVTGTVLDTAGLDAGYWFRNLRQTVRFAEVVRGLLDQGFTAFVEISPHPVLTVPVEQTIEAADAKAVAFGTLQRGTGPARFAAALGDAHVHGVPVAWETVVDPADARRVALPTYPFRAERFWAQPRVADGDTAGAGLENTGHPLLAASTQLADGSGRLFTGRLTRAGHTWLADHAVHGTVLLPGTAFVELAARAGGVEGCPVVEELTLEEPLSVPADGERRLQTVLAAPDEHGRRTVTVHSKDAEAAPEAPWTRHAAGVVSPGGPEDAAAPSPEGAGTPWPPPGAEPVDITPLYDALADRGFGYGPAFQGVRAAWSDGGVRYAEVASGVTGTDVTGDMDGAHYDGSGGFAIHPALLDAAFHAQLSAPAAAADGDSADAGVERADAGVWLPFAWSGVRVHREGARRLRVVLTPLTAPGTADGTGRAAEAVRTMRMRATDEEGRLVVTVDSVTARPVGPERLAALRDAGDALFRLDWLPAAPSGEGFSDEAQDSGGTHPPGPIAVLGAGSEEPAWAWADQHYADLDALTAALDAGRPAPGAVLAPFPSTVHLPAADEGTSAADRAAPPVGAGSGALPSAEAVHAHAARALGLLHHWTGDERLAGTVLAAVTTGAVATAPTDPADPETAAVWGLLRSAQAEHPGRFALVDVDSLAGVRLLPTALALGDPQLAVRNGTLLMPRVVRAAEAARGPLAHDPNGTVLITGGTSGIGASVARHLAARGARRLLLVSRRGAEAPEAAALVTELAALGAGATVAACDVADRSQLAALLAGIPAAHPLTAVVHSAGVLDDGLVADLTPDRLARVLRPKADAVLHLHELTLHQHLSSFVLFSSVAAIAGSPGQGNYAAANAFLDAFAHWRTARGLPALSLGWGLWEEASDMTGRLGEGGVARLNRSGVAPMPTGEALRLFDTVHGAGHSHLVPVRFDLGALRARARARDLPPVLAGLVPARPGPDGPPRSLAAILAATPDERREETVRTLVARQVATALGHEHAAAVDPDRPLKELGVDSLGAVRIRNLLRGATGLDLPVTVVFEHPNVTALAAHLRSLAEQDIGASAEEEKQAGAAEAAAGTGARPAAHRALDRFTAELRALDTQGVRDVAERLRGLLTDLERRPAPAEPEAPGPEDDLASASAQEVFDLIDNGLEVR